MAPAMHEDSTSSAPQTEKSRFGVGAIASLIGVGFLLVFILQNNQSVDLDFLVWTFSWPLWFLIIVAALLGALVWFGLSVARRHRRRVKRRENRRN